MRIFFLGFLIFFSLNVWGGEILVATAANVRYAMDELRSAFKEKTGIDVKISVASSGKLTAQIKSGAPFDIFLSANMKYPNYLHEKGLALTKPKVYALGSLVIWSLKLKKEDVKKGMDVLKEERVKKIAIANPKNAPYGFEAMKALKKAGIYEDIKGKLIYGESVAQTSQYIASKVADIGFTAKSVVLSPKMRGKGWWIDVDSSLYDPIEQGAVILKNAKKHLKEVKAFYDFLFSEDAKEIFERYGYRVISKSK